MTVDDFVALIQEVRSDFEHEKDQGLLQDNLSKAQASLAGEYACDRILRRVEARTRVSVVRSSTAGRAR